MEFDNYPDYQEGKFKTWYCWTPNEQSSPFNAQLFCDVCDSTTSSDHEPFPPGSCEPDESEDRDALGYREWYINPSQSDANRDGIGDKCSAEVDIADLQQRNVTHRIWRATWTSEAAWFGCIDSPGCLTFTDHDGIPVTPDLPTDTGSGLPVRKAEDWLVAPTRGELQTLCEELVCGFGVDCTVKKHQVWPKQRMDFTVAGWSDTIVPTTLGACACETFGPSSCYGEFARCWRPIEGLWRTNPEQYAIQNPASEYYDVLRGRPRYAGFRRFGNRTPEMYGTLTITEVCQPKTTVGLVGPFGHRFWIDVGWDENPFPAPGSDGCQEIGMMFDADDRRSLEWGYTGQVEPDPLGSCGPLEDRDICWDRWFTPDPLRRGDQFWMDGHTTALRVAVIPLETDGQDYWQRQWHTPVYGFSPEGGGGDRDRPMPEAGFATGRDGEVGLVYFVAECGGGGAPDDYYEDGPIPWWEGGAKDSPDAGREVPVVVARVAAGRAAVTFDSAELMIGSGEVVPDSETFELDEPGFPTRDFATARLVLTSRTAASLFGYDGTESTVSVDVVVGGRNAAGQPLGDVWISRRWQAVPRFERLVQAGEPPAAITTEARPTPGGGAFVVAEPRLVVDTHRQRLLVLGGRTVGELALDRVYAFDLATRSWTAALGAGKFSATPTDAALGELAVDQARRRAFLVATGGSAVRVFQVDLDPSVPVFGELTATGSGPAARGGAAVVCPRWTDPAVRRHGRHPEGGPGRGVGACRRHTGRTVRRGRRLPGGRLGLRAANGRVDAASCGRGSRNCACRGEAGCGPARGRVHRRRPGRDGPVPRGPRAAHGPAPAGLPGAAHDRHYERARPARGR